MRSMRVPSCAVAAVRRAGTLDWLCGVKVSGLTRAPTPPHPPPTLLNEQFNLPLFRQLGDLGLLGLTVPPEYGGSGMDAAAVAIAHEELSAADPAFCLAYLAHALLFVNNLAQARRVLFCGMVGPRTACVSFSTLCGAVVSCQGGADRLPSLLTFIADHLPFPPTNRTGATSRSCATYLTPARARRWGACA